MTELNPDAVSQNNADAAWTLREAVGDADYVAMNEWCAEQGIDSGRVLADSVTVFEVDGRLVLEGNLLALDAGGKKILSVDTPGYACQVARFLVSSLPPRTKLSWASKDSAHAVPPAPGMFRKKPVVIEARQFLGGGAGPHGGPTPHSTSETHAIYKWIERNTQGSFDFAGDERPELGVSIDPADGRMVIATLEGDMHVSRGDWVIRGVQGEFYPCKPDIFDATYEVA